MPTDEQLREQFLRRLSSGTVPRLPPTTSAAGMPTDEQRERFEETAVQSLGFETGDFDREESGEYVEYAAEAAWQIFRARDAEVQALQAENQQLRQALADVNFGDVQPDDPLLAEAIELLEYAMYQGCPTIESCDLDPIPGQPQDGDWFDSHVLGTWRDIGDYLVKHAGWERHPSGKGRRQFYRPPAEDES